MAFLGTPLPSSLTLLFLFLNLLFTLSASLAAFVFPFANEDAALDMASLLAFRSAVTDAPLSVFEDWRPNTSPNACNWTGVTCSAIHLGRVVRIDLSNRRLAGQISPHIGNLSYLQLLNLSSNAFFGNIPSTLASLQKLHTLHLGTNRLSGAIPTSLGNLSSLRLLALGANNFEGAIPSSFGQLSNLERLGLYNNSDLGGPIPASLGGLKKLREFLSFNNGHTGPIPLALCNCSVLVKLELRGNKLRGIIPHCLGSLSRLQWLVLQRNSLHGEIPESIWNLTDLQILSFGHNNLRGTLPASLGKLLRIQTVDLSFNHFVGRIPEHLANCTEVTYLYLMSNQLSGALPMWLGRLSRLQELSLFTNKFTGTIPDSLQNCSKLQIIQLDENELEGTIPSSLGQLSQLSVLRLYSNRFVSGLTDSKEPIPAIRALYNCSSLTDVMLDNNFLRGTLPSDMGMHWPRISELSLGNCNISGPIPKSIGNFSSLVRLYLQGNLITGHIPETIGSMKSIQALNLGDNGLSGGFPRQITLLNGSLAYLYLDNNKLSGPLPAFIGNLANLQELYLSSNSFYGRIPPQLGKCKNLIDLRLSWNKFSGTIPPEVADLKHIQEWFDLSGNSLQGNVPAEIGGLNMAQHVDLSQNQLRGRIGFQVIQWLNAQYINLSFNNFSGELPESIAKDLTQLEFMDVSHNNFTGNISESFFNLSQLRYLDVSYNNFQGRVPCSTPFTNTSNFSLAHNPHLCGDCFSLRKCKTRNHLGLFPSICISLGGVLLLCICIVLLLFKTKARTSSTLETRSLFLGVLPEEIRAATQNFSSTNVIGQGRHGVVYKGTLQEVGEVAIKLFSVSNSAATSDSMTFTRECETLGKVRHRNLMKVITACTSIDFKALILPLMPTSLHKILHQANAEAEVSETSFNLQIRLRILQDLAAALTYLHHDCSPRIVHCDVKPQNVLLDEEMTVHLSDFGISRLLHQGFSSASATAAAIGSPGYSAPEYGITGRASAKGDVYSFGIVVLEVLTGLMPTHPMFDGELTLPNWISAAFLQNMEKKEEMRERLRTVLGKGRRGIEREIQNEKEWKAVEALMKIGILCSCQRAEQRPSMKKVQGMLYSISTNENESDDDGGGRDAEHGMLSSRRRRCESFEIFLQRMENAETEAQNEAET